MCPTGRSREVERSLGERQSLPEAPFDRPSLREDTDPTRADEQPDDDQHDPPQHLPAENGEDAGDDQYDRQNPEQRDHSGPPLRPRVGEATVLAYPLVG